ncbi:hypothetical protein BD408DRAFT_460263 [Parasitella parasitica]|nr:hypothetical protein BD408DRAFT_460263 [Parasitella parasitica]
MLLIANRKRLSYLSLVMNLVFVIKASLVIKSTEVSHGENNNTGEVHTLFTNKPSKYIEFLMADPVNSPALLQSTPDFTPDELTCLQQGEKWRINEMFQSPMHSNGTLDIWVGDLVNTNYAGTNNCFLVSRFYHKTISGSTMASWMFSVNINVLKWEHY